MTAGSLHYLSSSIHYLRFGSGKKLLFCFHGYGEDASSFSFLESHIENLFTVISVDLPHHGKTNWNNDDDFLPVCIAEIVSRIMDQENLKEYPLHVLGFSMGGRVALQLAALMPQNIRKLILLAPDGMVVNKWYWLATQTKTGNRLFAYVMKRPEKFLKLVQLSKRMRLINVSVFKFIHTYLDDPQIRNTLYQRWTCMRKIRPGISRIKENIVRQQIQVRFLYGKFDRIILSKRAENFCYSVKGLGQIKVIDAGHQLLQEKHIDDIVLLLNN